VQGKLYRLKRVLFGALVPAILICGLLAASADARLSRSVAQGAGNVYSTSAVQVVNDTTSSHNADSAPIRSGLFRMSSNTFRYLAKWRWAYDSNGTVHYSCWMHIVIQGNNTKQHITREHNPRECAEMPVEATTWSRTGVLQWGYW
jgi:hypothetical protein